MQRLFCFDFFTAFAVYAIVQVSVVCTRLRVHCGQTAGPIVMKLLGEMIEGGQIICDKLKRF